MQDGACAASSLWLFDKPGQTGNQICFESQFHSNDGLGAVDLGTLCRVWSVRVPLNGGPPVRFCSATWNSAVKSYWAGDDSGFLVDGKRGLRQTFVAWQRVDNVGIIGDGLSSVGLDYVF